MLNAEFISFVLFRLFVLFSSRLFLITKFQFEEASSTDLAGKSLGNFPQPKNDAMHFTMCHPYDRKDNEMKDEIHEQIHNNKRTTQKKEKI